MLFIPAAGEATRLKPLTNNSSKAMVRVNGRPCIDYIVNHLEKIADVEQYVIVDGKFDDIRDYVNRRFLSISHKFTFVKQETLNGPREAINIGCKSIKEKTNPLIVWLGDAIILDDDLPIGTDFLLCKEESDHSQWCVWTGDAFFNKPKTNIPNGVALVGMYSFSDGPSAIQAFNSANSYDISFALEIYGTAKFERVMTNRWYDIGELPTYYKTCASLLNLKAREFNTFTYNSELNTITKSPRYSSAHSIETINNEKSWYTELNETQRLFVPRIIINPTSLIMSYESGNLLSDLMLYENLSSSTWEYIIERLLTIIDNHFHTDDINSGTLNSFPTLCENIWIKKSIDRMKHNNFNNIRTFHELLSIAKRMIEIAVPVNCIHGDLHFGNIIYNTTNDHFIMVDPRGNFGGRIGKFGDKHYDYCKLAHDLYWGYNSIVNNVNHNLMVKNIFEKKIKERGLPFNDIINGGLLLIATCIPLHSDNQRRQMDMRVLVETNLNG